MSENRKVKEEAVAVIKKKLEDCQSAILVDYRGLTVAEVTELRNQFRAANVEYRVLKNSLVERAADALQISDLKQYLAGPTAIAFGYEDPVAPAKIINDYIKKAKKTEIKCGLVNGTVIDVAGVKALADLPPREVLIAKMLGSMNAPITGMVGVCAGVLRSLLYTLNAVAEKKEA